MNDDTSIRSVLDTLTHAEDKNIATVVAGTLNLYIETQRMLSGKRMLTAKDVRNIFDILLVLLSEPPEGDYAKSEPVRQP